ncbi:hypothetical protein BH20VER1_BH20VER1_15060 [soil metagenome]
MVLLRYLYTLLLVVAFVPTPARADEAVRQAQEELRRRNLYFGDVDGRATPELSAALRRYQERKGFEVSGTICPMTAASLNIQKPVGEVAQANWPEVPVLRSDNAVDIASLEQVPRQEVDDDEQSDLAPTPPPPAESPGPGQDITRQRVQQFVENYLRAGETEDVEAQVRYFEFPVQKYLWHGKRERDFVARDLARYAKRWPERKYMLTEPVQVVAGQNGETIVEFPIAFSVRNSKHHVTGRTRNVWTIQPEGDELKIVSIWEERLRN